MNKIFSSDESLYRAVYPPELASMYWKDAEHVSSAAFLDKKGLSVERGNFRSDYEVVQNMKIYFIGRIVRLAVRICNEINALVIYRPTKRSLFHSEIHGNEKSLVLSPSQRRHLSLNCQLVSEI